MVKFASWANMRFTSATLLLFTSYVSLCTCQFSSTYETEKRFSSSSSDTSSPSFYVHYEPIRSSSVTRRPTVYVLRDSEVDAVYQEPSGRARVTPESRTTTLAPSEVTLGTSETEAETAPTTALTAPSSSSASSSLAADTDDEVAELSLTTVSQADDDLTTLSKQPDQYDQLVNGKQYVLKAEQLQWTKNGRYKKFPIMRPKLGRASDLVSKPDQRRARKWTYEQFMVRLNQSKAAMSRRTPSSPSSSSSAAASSPINGTENGTTKKAAGDSHGQLVTTQTRGSANDLDMLELSSSDRKMSTVSQDGVRRPKRMNFGHRNLSPDSKKNQSVPKLLLPKPVRPAMYSLDGFIPKPKRLTVTTTTPAPPVSSSYSRTRTHKSYQALDDGTGLKKRQSPGRPGKYSRKLDDLSTSDSNANGKRVSLHAKRSGPAKAGPLPPPAAQDTGDKVVAKGSAEGKKNFPTYATVPKTTFECEGRRKSGSFADYEAGCQVWHMCQGYRKHSFLCPNGTIFNENAGVCDWWYNVDCTLKKVTQAEPLMSLSSSSKASVTQSKVTLSQRRKASSEPSEPKPIKSFAHLIDFEALLLRSG
ncbi:hypothetical protein HDE_14207 [Halotydeus destructor]|nr:hypothetical protein HDE_14207 [Halotydeus destructor]